MRDVSHVCKSNKNSFKKKRNRTIGLLHVVSFFSLNSISIYQCHLFFSLFGKPAIVCFCFFRKCKNPSLPAAGGITFFLACACGIIAGLRFRGEITCGPVGPFKFLRPSYLHIPRVLSQTPQRRARQRTLVAAGEGRRKSQLLLRCQRREGGGRSAGEQRRGRRRLNSGSHHQQAGTNSTSAVTQ